MTHETCTLQLLVLEHLEPVVPLLGEFVLDLGILRAILLVLLHTTVGCGLSDIQPPSLTADKAARAAPIHIVDVLLLPAPADALAFRLDRVGRAALHCPAYEAASLSGLKTSNFNRDTHALETRMRCWLHV